MRKFSAIALSLPMLMGSGAAYAQPRDGDRDGGRDRDSRPALQEHRDRAHPEWREGYRMDHDDWARGRHVDYRAYRLREPRPGYEWREVDGRFVLAAIATGVIASIVLNPQAHY